MWVNWPRKRIQILVFEKRREGESREYRFAGHVTLYTSTSGDCEGSKVGAWGLGLHSACDLSPPWCLSVAACESGSRLCHVSRYLDGVDVLFPEETPLYLVSRPRSHTYSTVRCAHTQEPFLLCPLSLFLQALRVASGVLCGSIVAPSPLTRCVM